MAESPSTAILDATYDTTYDNGAYAATYDSATYDSATNDSATYDNAARTDSGSAGSAASADDVLEDSADLVEDCEVDDDEAWSPMPVSAVDAVDFSAVMGGLDDASAEPTWQDRALCAQTDPEAFFPEKGGSTREAKRVCSGCEVRAECLEYALANDERFGIWGGLSERERRRLRRRAG